MISCKACTVRLRIWNQLIQPSHSGKSTPRETKVGTWISLISTSYKRSLDQLSSQITHNISKFYMAGAFPGCSQLWAQAVPCNADSTLHYHVLDGGHRLNQNLDLEEHQQEVPYPCKSSLARRVLANNSGVGKGS